MGVVLVVVVVVTGVKQSQLLVLRLRLEFDNMLFSMAYFVFVIQRRANLEI